MKVNARLVVLFLFVIIVTLPIYAQTTEFTYQGSLQNSSAPASGNFDFEFLLFDSLTGGVQQGATLTRSTVAVAAGTFAVKLDFGGQFPGANRFLEIHVRTAGGGAFTPLTPRQSVGSSPYAVQSVRATSAATADTVSANSVTGVLGPFNGGTGIGGSLPPAGGYLRSNGAGWEVAGLTGNGSLLTNLNGANVTGTVTNAVVPAGNINGVLTASQGGTGMGPALPPAGGYLRSNGFGWELAGLTGNGSLLTNLNGANVTGTVANASSATTANTATTAGNVTGVVQIANGGTGSATKSFVDLTTDQAVAGNKTFSGTFSSNVVNATTQYNIGGSQILGNAGTNNLFAGVDAGSVNTTGLANAFFGKSAGPVNTTGGGNAFFGNQAGFVNTTGFNNAFFGFNAGNSNTTGSNNTIIGTGANVGSGNLTSATAIGAGSIVSASNTVVLGTGTDAVQIPGALSVTGALSANGSALTNLNGANVTGTVANASNATTANTATTAGNVTGVVQIANGGTGSATKNFVDLTTDQAVAGNKTFSGTLSSTIVNATTQYNIGSNRVLSVGGTNNLFAGINAGIANTGYSNSFFGRDVGSVNTTGNSNSFFGIAAGQSNTTGSNNAFFGPSAGAWNVTGDFNTGIGFGANVQSANLTYATAIGAGARVFTSNTVVLGTGNDTVNIPGDLVMYKQIQVGNLPTDPFTCTSAKSGSIYFNYNSNFLKFCNSGVWYIIPNTTQFSMKTAEQQQTQIDSQQKQIDEQRKQIESLTKIVCAINSKADICRQ